MCCSVIERGTAPRLGYVYASAASTTRRRQGNKDAQGGRAACKVVVRPDEKIYASMNDQWLLWSVRMRMAILDLVRECLGVVLFVLCHTTDFVTKPMSSAQSALTLQTRAERQRVQRLPGRALAEIVIVNKH